MLQDTVTVTCCYLYTLWKRVLVSQEHLSGIKSEVFSCTYAMFPELLHHSQAEDVGYLCVHRETGGQDVPILRHTTDTQQTHG